MLYEAHTGDDSSVDSEVEGNEKKQEESENEDIPAENFEQRFAEMRVSYC